MDVKMNLRIITKNHANDSKIGSPLNSQAPEPVRGPAARFARSGENGEGEVRSL